jgi:hypothetical protein
LIVAPTSDRRAQQALYARQRRDLEVEHARSGCDVFVSPFDVLRTGDGTELSYCAWPERVRSWLPRADCIAFTGKEGDKRWHMIVPWDAAVGICGGLLERVPGVDPVRYENVGYPDAAQLRRRSLSTSLRHPGVRFTEQPCRSRPPARAC